jgi:hypothetical protein
LSSLISIIKNLEDLIFSLEYQSSNCSYLEIPSEPSFLGPNYNEFTICFQELGSKEDHDHIMMLTDQPTSHTPNTTLLKSYRKTQSQDHISFQASYLHAYDGEVDYENEEVNFDHVKPIYDTFLFVDDANEWSKKVVEDSYDFIDTYGETSFEDLHEFDLDLDLYNNISNLLFQSREVKKLDTSLHIPPRCTFSFNDDEYFKDIPMFLNPYYESSLHYDDHVPDRKIPRDHINLFDE